MLVTLVPVNSVRVCLRGAGDVADDAMVAIIRTQKQPFVTCVIGGAAVLVSTALFLVVLIALAWLPMLGVPLRSSVISIVIIRIWVFTDLQDHIPSCVDLVSFGIIW